LKLRMTVDQLEIQLRQNNVTNISDVQYATLEPSGKLGFILKQNKQNATKEDIQYILDQIQQLRQEIELKLPQTKVVFKANPKQNQSTNPNPPNTQTNPNQPIQNSLFEEVRDKGHHEEPPQYLQ
ncbi:YetF domain-containing protein, partial [Actinocorallia longicatena]